MDVCHFYYVSQFKMNKNDFYHFCVELSGNVKCVYVVQFYLFLTTFLFQLNIEIYLIITTFLGNILQ